jgi:hypothetical protein
MSECRLVRVLFLILLIGLVGCSRKRTEADFLESGKRFFQKQDYARALLEFKNASQLKQGDAEPFYQAGLA